MTPQQISTSLKGRTKSFSDEVRLHEEMATAFLRAGYEFQREVRIDGGRLDFLFADGTALEVKVKGSGQAAVRQVIRYFKDPLVLAAIIVSTRPMALPIVGYTDPYGIRRPIHLVELWRNAL